jgi:hypothetical protein
MWTEGKGAAWRARARWRRARAHSLLVVHAARDEDVVEDLVGDEPEALRRDLADALDAEGVLRVHDDDLAGGAAVLARELARDGQRRRELRLARAELAEDLGHGAGLEPAAEDAVELLAARRDAHARA